MTAEADEPTAGSRRKGGRPSAMTDEMRTRIKPLLEAGVRVPEIARQVGLDTSTIYKYRAQLLGAEADRATGASRK
jgi:hypothetical protein